MIPRAPSVLFLLLPGLAAAAETDAPVRKKLETISLLPDGSQLHRVMLPRYDEASRLVGVLHARKMTLVNSETISGDGIRVEFYQKDGSPRGQVDLANAVFRQDTGILSAEENVTLSSDRLFARGSAIDYSFDDGEGFLHGPVTTWIRPEPETAMHRPADLPGRAILAGLAVLSQPLVAVPPTLPDETESAAIADDAKSSASVVAAGTKNARADLIATLDASAEATRAARDFLEKSGNANNPAGPPIAAPVKPLDVNPGPEDTVVRSDGGMYFDPDEGVFVFLGNVRVEDPRFQLSGANELKIFVETEEKKPETKKEGNGLGIEAKFGKVERIVATGAVRILQRGTEGGKQPVEASGALFVYRPETGVIDISGGYPWVKQGTSYLRAKQPNLHLRIHKDGRAVTEGDWEMGGRIDQDR
ncbi:MAG: hypothetical protein H7A48_05100 [Akkermansiaceae bacterium]|nr:hypothetical protein [Akkermansiaceae bacterium]MCP5545794.1 hypothetical protein [Akkermansiaceae bacterium]